MPKWGLGGMDGGDYAPVADRIILFYERYAEGRIVTELVSRTEREVTFKAMVYRTSADREPAATGWASELEGDGDINSVACLENTETSAIGRALANLGFTASPNRPSAEEMLKASRARSRAPAGQLAMRVVPGGGQSREAAVLDATGLLETAERAGLRAAKAYALRARLGDESLTIEEIERIERSLRGWLARHSRR